MKGYGDDGEDADDDEAGEGGSIGEFAEHGEADCWEGFHEFARAEGEKVEGEGKEHGHETVDKADGLKVESGKDVELVSDSA